MSDSAVFLTTMSMLFFYRVTILLVGAMSIYLGYRLFVKGYFTSTAGDMTASIGSAQVALKAAAPGVFFGVFGVSIVTVSLMFSVQGEKFLPQKPETQSIKPVLPEPYQPEPYVTGLSPLNTGSSIDPPLKPLSASDQPNGPSPSTRTSGGAAQGEKGTNQDFRFSGYPPIGLDQPSRSRNPTVEREPALPLPPTENKTSGKLGGT